MCWIDPKISTIYPGISPKSPLLLVQTKNKEIKIGYLKIETIETEAVGKLEFPVYRFEDGERIKGSDINFWFAIPEIPNWPERLNEKTPLGDAIV